jgi:hypothetical protein
MDKWCSVMQEVLVERIWKVNFPHTLLRWTWQQIMTIDAKEVVSMLQSKIVSESNHCLHTNVAQRKDHVIVELIG